MEGEDIFDNDLNKFEGSGGGCSIPWVNNPVATNGDSSSIEVIFWGEYLAHNFCVSDIYFSIHRYVFIPNDSEGLSPINTLFIGAFISCTNALAEMSKLIAVGFFPNILVFGIETELAVFKGLTHLSV